MSASYLPSFFEVNIPTTEPLNDLLSARLGLLFNSARINSQSCSTCKCRGVDRLCKDFYAKRRRNIDKHLESARDGLMARIQDLFSDPFFEPTKTWFQNIVYRGADLRDKYYRFILDVYRSKDLLKEGLANIIANLGGPHT